VQWIRPSVASFRKSLFSYWSLHWLKYFSCRSLASNQIAWQHTRCSPGMVPDNPPSDHLIWATTATKGATSWTHIDSNGLGTFVDNIVGSKYWVVMNRRREIFEDVTSAQNPLGDLSSMHALPKNWDPWSAVGEAFEHEAVVLTPGSLL
jgi:hypothetical protein